MSNSTEIELNDSAKELIRVCSEIEGTLKSLGYTKVDSEPGIGEYMSDLHGTEEPSFSFCTKGKYPVRFDCYQDMEKPFAFYEVKSILKDRDSRTVSLNQWLSMISNELSIPNKKETQMAEKNQNTNPRNAEDKAMDMFCDLMVEKISSIKDDWRKPWFSPQASQPPMNMSGRSYNGFNSIILMIQQEKNGWQTSRYATFDRITSLNYTKDKQGARNPATDKDGEKLPLVSVKKGEKSTPVMLTTFTVVNPETKERMKYDDYKQMSEEERAKWNVYPKLQTYHVFNLDQTNLKESRPELYQKFLDEAKGLAQHENTDKFEVPSIDAMIEKDLYVCPIKPTRGDDAYYSISKDEIVIPEKAQFTDNEAFYSNLLHEMSHASGSESRLNRLKPSSFGSAEYAKEELVAELTAALVASQHGMEKGIKHDSAAYLKSWLDSLHENPDFIKTVLMDVKRSSSFINQRIDAVDEVLKRDGWEADFTEVREKNKGYTPSFYKTRSNQNAVVNTQQQEQQVKPEPVIEEQVEEVAAKNVTQPRFHR